MAVAVLFACVVVCAGFAVLRTLRLASGALALGLAPAAGVAVLSIQATWCAYLHVPPPAAGVLLACVSALGLGLALADRQALRLAAATLRREHRPAALVLALALAVTALCLGLTFASSQVPLSPHDGAFHVQVIQARRSGAAWAGWYPPGLSSLFAAMLELLPWLDSAKGTLELGLALPLLALIGVFGLAVAVWHNVLVGSASALLLSFTYVFPYFPELWSGLPLELALILVIGEWAVGLAYLAAAGWRKAVLSGLLVGSMVLVHGSELLTLLAILLVLLASARARLDWPALVRHAGLGAGVALVCAAPYLPTLFAWAGTGGAYAVGIEDGQAAVGNPGTVGIPGLGVFAAFGLDALGLDLPIRLLLVGLGVAYAFRARTGRAVVAVGGLFTTLAVMFTLFNDIPAIRQAYAATFPWGMHYRLFMVVAVAQVLLAGRGLVEGVRWLDMQTGAPTHSAHRLRRTSRLVGLAWLGLMTWAMTVFLAYPVGRALGYGAEDAAAMAWLREHASPGDVLANDGFADAGIWAPYKAGVEVLLPRVLQANDVQERQLVLENVAHLDDVPTVTAAACAYGVAYVYSGARTSAWDERHFPPLAELRASPALAEVFASGEAVVFKTRLTCPSS